MVSSPTYLLSSFLIVLLPLEESWKDLLRLMLGLGIFFAALQVPKLLQYMNSPLTFSVLTFTLVLIISSESSQFRISNTDCCSVILC